MVILSFFKQPDPDFKEYRILPKIGHQSSRKFFFPPMLHNMLSLIFGKKTRKHSKE
jgi:hypothetical protein